VLKGHTDSVDGAQAFEDGRILSWSELLFDEAVQENVGLFMD
jgi:hypothetical protein